MVWQSIISEDIHINTSQEHFGRRTNIQNLEESESVSYTHLTLPTILLV